MVARLLHKLEVRGSKLAVSSRFFFSFFMYNNDNQTQYVLSKDLKITNSILKSLFSNSHWSLNLCS